LPFGGVVGLFPAPANFFLSAGLRIYTRQPNRPCSHCACWLYNV